MTSNTRQNSRRGWVQAIVGTALSVLLIPHLAMAADAIVAVEPTDLPASRFTNGEGVTTISWYFTGESPRRERQIAQTVEIAQAGEAKHFAIQLSSHALTGLGDNANYELKVYESSTRPDRAFINRHLVLTQEGVIREGEGGWLVFPLDGNISLKASHFYTFAFSFKDSSSGNKVIFNHSQGSSDKNFRWHRSGRDSWVPSPLSLHYIIY